MEINDFIAIGVVGAGLSLALSSLKAKFGTKGAGMKAIVLLMSCLVGGLYVWLRATPYFETTMTVLGSATVVYAYFLKK